MIAQRLTLLVVPAPAWLGLSKANMRSLANTRGRPYRGGAGVVTALAENAKWGRASV